MVSLLVIAGGYTTSHVHGHALFLQLKARNF